MKYGCIAEHLGHSFSKIIHSMIDSYDYTLREVPADELHNFMSEKNFEGINVTIPYKQDVIPYLDFISDEAKKIGAVNTIVNRDGKLYGYNTDFGGMSALIKKMKLDLCGKKVLILGSGGTSKTANAVASSLGAEKIITVSRQSGLGYVTYDDAYKYHSDADAIINTTPCGMFPNIDDMPIDINNFKNLCGVVDAIFNPLSSRLVLTAKERGIAAEGGLYMLVSQAVKAAEIFMEKKYDETITDRIYNKLFYQKENIVLIGMPGSGKTTVGQKIADGLGREFIDTDEIIVKKSGRTISDIFEKDGEEYFRKIETDVVREISKKTGVVISTGGGCVLREKNTKLLKLNGKVIFLNRKPEDIVPTLDRPLADSAQKIQDVYKKRIDIYTSAADEIIDVCENADYISQKIITYYKKISGGDKE